MHAGAYASSIDFITRHPDLLDHRTGAIARYYDVAAITTTEERLDPATRLRERIMLGLRMKEGVDIEAAAAEVGAEAYPEGRSEALDRMEIRGRIVRREGRVAATRESWIWADDTAASLF